MTFHNFNLVTASLTRGRSCGIATVIEKQLFVRWLSIVIATVNFGSWRCYWLIILRQGPPAKMLHRRDYTPSPHTKLLFSDSKNVTKLNKDTSIKYEQLSSRPHTTTLLVYSLLLRQSNPARTLQNQQYTSNCRDPN